MIAVISPETAQNAALAWIGVVSVVSIAALGLAATLLPKIATLFESVKNLKALHESSQSQIQSNTNKIAEVALATPPPSVHAVKPVPSK